MNQTFGISALLTLCSHLVFILLVWRTMLSLRVEKIVKAGHTREAQLLMMFIAIGLGYLVSSCFLSLVTAVKNLSYLIS